MTKQKISTNTNISISKQHEQKKNVQVNDEDATVNTATIRVVLGHIIHISSYMYERTMAQTVGLLKDACALPKPVAF